MLKNPNNLLKNGLLITEIFILIVGSYEFSFSSIPSIFAQLIPKAVQSNDDITTNSGSDTTTTHTSCLVLIQTITIVIDSYY
jgi:hypothetical protein